MMLDLLGPDLTGLKEAYDAENGTVLLEGEFGADELERIGKFLRAEQLKVLAAALRAPAKAFEIGNVLKKNGGRKFVLTHRTIGDVIANPDDYALVCECAHDDDDFSYLCTARYCRCSQ